MQASRTMSLSIEKEVEAGSLPSINGRKVGKAMKLTLLLMNRVILSIGNTAGPLLLRLYFINGGTRKWLCSWLETGGWPILLIPLSINYLHRRSRKGSHEAKFVFMTPPLFAACLVLGIMTGLDDYLYAYGVSRLPVSTSALLVSSQLAFQAVFAFFIVRHKFTPYSINAVLLLTVGSVTLGLHTKGDRPKGETRLEYSYFIGLGITIAAAALYGSVLPLIELTCMKARQAVTYSLVLEMQTVMGFFATAFSTVGMLVNKDFDAIRREGQEYKLGEANYYVLLFFSAIVWQLFCIGTIGVIACSSSLHAGVVIAALLPVTELLAVFFFDEKFTTVKGISMVLCFWGFVSYFYGEHRQKAKKSNEAERQQQPPA